MAAGDYLHWQFQFKRVNTDVNVLTTTDYSTATALITPKTANHQLVIQKVSTNITTYSAKTWTYQDSASTPVPLGLISIPAAAVALPSESGSIIFDFGPTGAPLTVGKSFDLKMSASGAAGFIHIEAYEKLGNPTAAASTN